MLCIFTNGYVQLDLLNFIDWHNDIHESILQRPLKIVTFNRQQIAMHALKFPAKAYLDKLSKLEFTGYKSQNSAEREQRKLELTEIGTCFIDKIERAKRGSGQNDFLYYPTIKWLLDVEWFPKEKIAVFNQLFQAEIYFQSALHQKYTDRIRVTVGHSFFIIVKISNFFFDEIDFTICLASKELVKFIGPCLATGGEHLIGSSVHGISDKLITIPTKIERIPFKKITAFIQVNHFRVPLEINHIQVENLFFLAPFIGEKNNRILSYYKEKADRVAFEEKFFLGLITGEAGVGKSRLIQEILDHCYSYDIRLFRSELIAKEGRRTLLRDIIAYFTGIDPVSFTDINDQLFNRYQNDKHFAGLFHDEEEFNSFKNTINTILLKGLDQISFIKIDKIAEFIGNSVLHLGRKYLVVFVIEDLHHADKSIFYFISKLYQYLKTQKSRIIFLLAGRTEAKDLTPAFREFNIMISTDSTYSITRTQVEPLSEKDSLSLIRELVQTESKFESIIQQTILVKTGNNPFNIIHTLLYLKNAGIIIQKDEDYEWRYINRLKGVTIHAEIERLFQDRFDFYFSILGAGEKFIDIIAVIGLFESQINQQDLMQIGGNDDIAEILLFLQKERIIRIEGESISFDHENILQYVQANILPGALRAAEKVIHWLGKRKNKHVSVSLKIRCLNICLKIYPKLFFKTILPFLDALIVKDNWSEIIRYGEMFINAYPGHENYVQPLQKCSIMFSIAYVLSEYSDLATAIRKFEELETELAQINYDLSKRTSNKSQESLLLLFKTRLYKCDAIIMASEYEKAEIILLNLLENITDAAKNIKEPVNQSILSELHCWALNRLAVSFRASGYTIKAILVMKKSLRLSRQIKHDYFIHHNYYDLAGCYVHLDRIEEAFAIHRKCLLPLLTLPTEKNALARTKIRTGLFYFLLKDMDGAIVELESAIQIARENGYLWELTRGLINQANIYFYQKKIIMAHETYKTCLHFVDTHNAKSFHSCLYNNLAFLHLHNYHISKNTHELETSLSFLKNVLDQFNDMSIYQKSEHRNIRVVLTLLNLFSFKEFLDRHCQNIAGIASAAKEVSIAYENLFPLKSTIIKPDFIEHFRVHLSEDTSFYLMFMSFG